MSDEMTVLGVDGIRRSFGEHYDTLKEVEQDPTGAMWAIHKQADRIEELETQLSEARQVGMEWFEEQKKARNDANAAEAKLAKAVEDLEFIALNFNKPNAGLSAFGERQHYLFVACRLRDKARSTLAELKGEQ